MLDWQNIQLELMIWTWGPRLPDFVSAGTCRSRPKTEPIPLKISDSLIRSMSRMGCSPPKSYETHRNPWSVFPDVPKNLRVGELTFIGSFLDFIGLSIWFFPCTGQFPNRTSDLNCPMFRYALVGDATFYQLNGPHDCSKSVLLLMQVIEVRFVFKYSKKWRLHRQNQFWEKQNSAFWRVRWKFASGGMLLVWQKSYPREPLIILLYHHEHTYETISSCYYMLSLTLEVEYTFFE